MKKIMVIDIGANMFQSYKCHSLEVYFEQDEIPKNEVKSRHYLKECLSKAVFGRPTKIRSGIKLCFTKSIKKATPM